MAVLLANNVAEVVALERSRARGITGKVKQRLNSGNRPIASIPKPVPPPKLSEGTPMDLDAIAANIGFTYALFKQECIAKGLCHKCAGPFDSVHEELSGCPRPEDKQLTLENKLMLWKNWGGYVRKKKTGRKSTLPKEPLFKGKKRENMSALEASPIPKRREGDVKLGGIPSASTSNDLGPGPSNSQAIAAMEADPMSSGELLFEQQLSGFGKDDCKQQRIVDSFSAFDNQPLFQARFKNWCTTEVNCVVPIDSGATSSFINTDHVSRNRFELEELEHKIQCQSFDGSFASTGDIVHFVDGRLSLPLVSGPVVVISFRLNVTKIASADIILGSSWLREFDFFVGGTDSSLVFNHIVQSSCSSNDADVAKLMEKYSDVFVTRSLESLPPHREHFDCEVNLKEGVGKIYNLSKNKRDQLRLYVDENIAKVFIQVLNSPAAAPIFYVKVAGKADRPCVDYWLLNSMTVCDSYPLPVISLLLNNLQGCKFLSNIDLKAAFNLLRVAPGHEWKTVFRTPWGLYEYKVMPFGLANAPATFQRFIQHVLREYLDVCCFVYIDDILIFLKTQEAHLLDLDKVLSKLQEYNLKALLLKCEFFSSKVTFLGFDITQLGLKMNEKKLSNIASWPFPSDLKELRRFLGYTNFYRKFILRFSEVAGPLTTLTQEDKQGMIKDCPAAAVAAFLRLK
jgi:hypothetical protein